MPDHETQEIRAKIRRRRMLDRALLAILTVMLAVGILTVAGVFERCARGG